MSVGAAPAQILRTGSLVLTANRGDESLSVLDTDPALRERDRFAVSDATHPHGLATTPGGDIVFLTFQRIERISKDFMGRMEERLPFLAIRLPEW